MKVDALGQQNFGPFGRFGPVRQHVGTEDDDDGRDQKTAPDQFPQGQRHFRRHAAEHGHDGGIPRKLHRRFPEQTRKIEAIGLLQAGQGFENAQEIIRALSASAP